MNPELDEIGWEALVNELSRRGSEYGRGNCPYCKKKLIQMGEEHGHKKYHCTCKFGNNIAHLWVDWALSRWQGNQDRC